ncbi:MAG: carbonic anhydrase, partial [Eubacteriales bacterium]
IGGGAHGYIATITDTISQAIGDEDEHRAAEILNLQNSMDRLMESEVLTHLVEEGQLKIVGGVYDAETGEVTFLDYVPASHG